MKSVLEKYIPVIGLEVHLQVLTQSKLFCGCATLFGQAPNSHVCPICLGLPGSLPVLNGLVVEQGIKMALATHCQIAPLGRFARKNYFYPDLPKGYQISMYELPLAERGFVEIEVNGIVKKIGLTRIHMEEDAGKNMHEGIAGKSHVDLNRAGVPLLEMVSEPDIRSPEEAAAYLKKLREIAVYTGASDADMEKGNLRCDANISLMPIGGTVFGTRAEIKNMNSFRFVQKALEYEIERQADILDDGGKVVLETRLWDTKRGATFSMRSKEAAHDYRYFPEPDLVPLQISVAWIDAVRKKMPELADSKRERFIRDYQIPEYDAIVLTASQALADFFEKAISVYGQNKEKAKVMSNWIMGALLQELKNDHKEIEEILFKPEDLATLLTMIDDGTISGKIAKSVFEDMYKTGASPKIIVQEKGLVQVSDEGALEKIIDEVVLANPKELAGFKEGKTKLMGFFVGEIMKKTQGKANPAKVNELLKKKLN
ncbi:MAG: Asp-tRNA(Asn)/Glu-tRNA(Gln) amidotransferase subunit GatB [Nitrospirota bacterium]